MLTEANTGLTNWEEALSELSFPLRKERAVLARVLKQISTVPGFLDLYHSFGIDPLRVGYSVVEQVGGTTVHWCAGGNSEAVAIYKPSKDAIVTRLRPASTSDILNALMTTGRFPFPLEVLLHERIHAVQYQEAIQRGSAILPMELFEAQAYRSEAMCDHISTREDLTRFISDPSDDGLYDHLIPQAVPVAIKLVDEMLALGVPHLSLAKMIGACQPWDGQRQTFPELAAARRQRKHLYGIDERGIASLVRARRENNSYKRIVIKEVATLEHNRAVRV